MDDINFINFKQILINSLSKIGYKNLDNKLLESISKELEKEFIELLKDKMNAYSVNIIKNAFTSEILYISKSDEYNKEIKSNKSDEIDKELRYNDIAKEDIPKTKSDLNIPQKKYDNYDRNKENINTNLTEKKEPQEYNKKEYELSKDYRETNINNLNPELKSILQDLANQNIYTSEELDKYFQSEVLLIEIDTKKKLIELYPKIFQSKNKSIIERINEYLTKTNAQIKIEINELIPGQNIKFYKLASKIVYNGEAYLMNKLDDSEKKYLLDTIYKMNSDQEGEILLQFYPEIKLNGEIILNGKALVSGGR